MDPEIKKILEAIAKKYFYNVPTLDTRGRDALDFHDIGVGALRRALEAAYNAGKAVGAGQPIPNDEVVDIPNFLKNIA